MGSDATGYNADEIHFPETALLKGQVHRSPKTLQILQQAHKLEKR